MHRLNWFVISFSLLSSGCADSGPSQPAGRQQSAPRVEETAQGPLVLWEYPALPYSAQHMEYLRLLQSELGVGTAVMELPPGKKDSAFRAEVNRHNEQTSQRIEAQHGQGALGRIRQKAIDNWEAKVKAAREKSAQGNP